MPTDSVLVVGSGIAGLTATLTALECGAAVKLVESERELGGTTALSAGWLWAYAAPEVASMEDGAGAEYLRWHIDFRAHLEWLVERAGGIVATSDSPRFTASVRLDTAQLIERLHERIERRSGVVQLGTRLVDLHQADDERGVIAALEEEATGVRWREEHGAVILAGGGYAGSLRMVADRARVYEATVDHWLRRNAGSADGSSQQAGISAGGRAVERGGICYSRLVPGLHSDAGPLTPREWSKLAPAWTGPDTSVELRAWTSERAHEVAAPRAVYDDWSGSAAAWWLARSGGDGVLRIPAVELARPTPYGAIGEVVRRLRERGAVLQSAADGGIQLEVRPGITHSLDGLETGAGGRVQGLRNVYAVGIDAAAPSVRAYQSGLAWGLVTGRGAGVAAATQLASS